MTVLIQNTESSVCAVSFFYRKDLQHARKIHVALGDMRIQQLGSATRSLLLCAFASRLSDDVTRSWLQQIITQHFTLPGGMEEISWLFSVHCSVFDAIFDDPSSELPDAQRCLQTIPFVNPNIQTHSY